MKVNKKVSKPKLKSIKHNLDCIDNLWVIIPAHNEQKRIGSVIDHLKPYTKNIVVVDDGSNDNTYKTVLSKNVLCLKHIVNLGKGAALRTGCDFALELGAKLMVVMDADGQHLPEDIPNLIKPLVSNKKDIVFGCRKWNQNMPFVFKVGNVFLSKYVAFMFGVNVSDTQSGFRAFTSNSYNKIKWNAVDYSMESEMIANVGKHKLNYAQISIHTVYLDRYKGTTILDGIKIGLSMLLWKLK